MSNFFGVTNQITVTLKAKVCHSYSVATVTNWK